MECVILWTEVMQTSHLCTTTKRRADRGFTNLQTWCFSQCCKIYKCAYLSFCQALQEWSSWIYAEHYTNCVCYYYYYCYLRQSCLLSLCINVIAVVSKVQVSRHYNAKHGNWGPGSISCLRRCSRRQIRNTNVMNIALKWWNGQVRN